MDNKLAETVSQLTPEEQSVVREFIDFIRQRKSMVKDSPFLGAIDEFIQIHPDLLRRLAQ